MGVIGFVARSAVWTVVVVALASLAIGAMGAGADYLGVDIEPPNTSLDEQKIEDEIHTQVNEIRTESSLIVLDRDRSLRQQTDAHTKRMAENDMLSHQIGRSTVDDRLGKADCGYGSENIIQSWSYEDVEVSDERTIRTGDEEAMADAIVTSWMNSDGHRENILTGEWRNTAVSVEIRHDKVYATQMFCE